MLALTTANSGIVTRSVTTTAPATAALLDAVVDARARTSIIVLATSPDSANTSPWAKLISCRIP